MYQRLKCPYSYFRKRWSLILGCFFPASIFNYTNDQNSHGASLRNNKKLFRFDLFFKLGLFNAILEAQRIFRIRLFSGDANNIFLENLWPQFLFQVPCRFIINGDIFMFFPWQFYFTFQTPMYVCLQPHIPSYLAQCRFLLFSLNHSS